MFSRPQRGTWALAAVLMSCATGEQDEQQQGPFVDIGTGGSDDSTGESGGSAGVTGGASTASGGNGAGEAPGSGGTLPTATGGRAAAGAAGQPGSSGGTGTGGGTSASAGTTGSGGASSGSGGALGKGGTLGSGGATGGAAGSTSCSTTEKVCGGVCVSKSPANGCSARSCSACSTAPSYGVSSCNAQGDCDFDCLTGFQKNGNRCTAVAGNGGAGGGGGSVTCNNRVCDSCPGSQVSCCDRLTGNLCVCALSNLVSALCK